MAGPPWRVLLRSSDHLGAALAQLRAEGRHTDARLVVEGGGEVRAHWAVLARHPSWTELGGARECGEEVVVVLPGRTVEEVEALVVLAYSSIGTALKPETQQARKLEGVKEEVDFESDVYENCFKDEGDDDDDGEDPDPHTLEENPSNFIDAMFKRSPSLEVFVLETIERSKIEGNYSAMKIAKTCLVSIDQEMSKESLEKFVTVDDELCEAVNKQCRRAKSGLYACTTEACDFHTTSRVVMKKHVAIHMEGFPFSCSACGEKFHRKENAVKHIRGRHVYTALKKFTKTRLVGPRTCTICNAKLKNRQSYWSHMAKVHDNKVSKCKLCEFSSMHYLEVSRHEREVHGTQDRSCHICGQHFKSKQGFDHHLENTHGDGVFPCVECGKEYRTEKALDNHMVQTHAPKTNFCDECAAKFSTPSALKRHKVMHVNDPSLLQHGCDVCTKKFKTAQHLSNHMQTHSSEKLFSCNNCGKAFGSKRALIRHKKVVHEGMRPFACNLCNYSAGQSHSLTVHYRGVHGRERGMGEVEVEVEGCAGEA